MSRKLLVLSALLVVLLSGCTPKSDNNSAAPDFKLHDLSGKTVKLSAFKGKPVLIDFWATWCPPCRAAVPMIERLHKTYGSRGLVVLSISTDMGGWDDVKSFVSEYGITYIVLKATDDVLDDYQVRTIPMVVLIGKDGRIAKRYLGYAEEDELEKDIKAVL